MESIKDNWEGIPAEDKTKWKVKPMPPFVEVEGEHVHCPDGYHYKKGYTTKYGYVNGFCVKNPRKRFGIV